MQFSTVAAVSAVAAVASASMNNTMHSNSTVMPHVTVTDIVESTTLVTITHCKDNACSTTVSPAVVSTATVTLDSTVTEYTTWCPLTAHDKTTYYPHTSLSNITSAHTMSSHSSVTEFTGAAARALPAAGALVAGVAALLL